MSHPAPSLIPVAVHGDTVLTVMVDGTPHVCIRSIVEALGLDWSSQRQRIVRHPVLKSTVVVTTTVATDGKQREMLCLPLGMLNGWLFGISAARVRPDLRARLVDYQRECFNVLAAHFGAGPAVAPAQPPVLHLAPSRYTADVDEHGHITLRPWAPGSVHGTPEQLAAAVADGGWPIAKVLHMQQACVHAMARHVHHTGLALAQARRAGAAVQAPAPVATGTAPPAPGGGFPQV